MPRGKTLESMLEERSSPGTLFEKRPDGNVCCTACAHRCVIAPGKTGICKVRKNRDGVLYVPRNYVAGLAIDPIEKKPFFHVLPGSKTLSFGMLGCNFHCDFCQNWNSSQTLKDPATEGFDIPIQDITAEALVEAAVQNGCHTVTSTYNEPALTTEWAVEIFQAARRHRLLTSFVSNGHLTPEALTTLRPHLDLLKIDLKCFNEQTYRKVMGGSMPAVLETIRSAKKMGFWVEVVTLVVPDMNDSDDEFRAIAEFLASVSVDIPWHVTAFQPEYKMEERSSTPFATLKRAVMAGKSQGLRYIYAGNLSMESDESAGMENTRCHHCNVTLIERQGFFVRHNQLRGDGRCPKCQTAIPGVWKITKG